jgi:molybdate transport system ATP-binding protein
MVALDAGGARLLARVTRKSADALQLAPGKAVFAQVKGVALLD